LRQSTERTPRSVSAVQRQRHAPQFLKSLTILTCV
jgi:hypothetical protein